SSRLTMSHPISLHDALPIYVTGELHPALRRVAIEAAAALRIPVVGLDLMVPDPAGETCWIIEANERPGLANHEPHPTAARFVDRSEEHTSELQSRENLVYRL